MTIEKKQDTSNKEKEQDFKLKDVMTVFDIKQRTYQFSLRIITLLKQLPKDYLYTTLGKQLLRSATSVGANISEAQAGTSRRDFANYYQIALKSANETRYWLSILDVELETSLKTNLSELLKEIDDICKVIASSLLRLKGRKSY